MFEDLSEKLEGIFKKLRGHGKLTEDNIKGALREVRRVLLEADVNYKVVKHFIDQVQQRAIGQEVLRSITPGQQIIKIVHDELVHLLGGETSEVKLGNTPPTIFMIVGLQGSGKTTVVAKLGRFFHSKGHRPMLVAADVYRPAAIDQLKALGGSINIPVYEETAKGDPVEICDRSIGSARQSGCDMVILDTAGRLHIDQVMMDELRRIKDRVSPHEILFVADGMTGQDAVNVAQEFLNYIDFDGIVLTKLDGDARGGAALSIRHVTGKPIKFIGVGEKTDSLELFHPDRMASRILGMGDIVSLVERVQETIDTEKAEKLERKLKKEEFSFEDFLEQLSQVKKMGPLDQILGMIPGIGNNLKGLQVDDRAFTRIEAIINSMTPEERRKPHIINGSRRRRIAAGSGTNIQDVNRLMKQFSMTQKMIKDLSKGKFKRFGAGSLPF